MKITNRLTTVDFETIGARPEGVYGHLKGRECLLTHDPDEMWVMMAFFLTGGDVYDLMEEAAQAVAQASTTQEIHRAEIAYLELRRELKDEFSKI